MAQWGDLVGARSEQAVKDQQAKDKHDARSKPPQRPQGRRRARLRKKSLCALSLNWS